MKNRLITRKVKIGKIEIGGGLPIVVQSMTTTETMQTEPTVNQIIELSEAGCEIARITAPNVAAAKNLANIKEGLLKKNVSIPLVADIHFTPEAALIAAEIVDKVRVNPGNYSDSKRFKQIEYTEKDYQLELEKVKEAFSPLVEVCKKNKTAMRIGANHGSLSDRIMSYYGDTPLGMVMSALEFLDICESLNYRDVVFSMKASNPLVMIEAYELLVEKMKKRGELYPLHLGVTEAGSDEQGRIKSSIGIGALLAQGFGDTVRVSLTEDPIYEIPVAKAIVEYYEGLSSGEEIDFSSAYAQTELSSFSLRAIPRVISDLRDVELSEETFKKLNHFFIEGKWYKKDISSDYFYLKKDQLTQKRPDNTPAIIESAFWDKSMKKVYPLFTWKEFENAVAKSAELNFLCLEEGNIDELLPEKIKEVPCVLVLKGENTHDVLHFQKLIQKLRRLQAHNPIALYPLVSQSNSLVKENKMSAENAFQINLACELSLALSKNLIQGVFTKLENNLEMAAIFDCYQASRKRISKTEFISCPSCGRTYFDLQKVTKEIKAHTAHLKNVRIGIMGCIVNGPGEMADADFGYVGAGKGMITLYKGQEIVARNIPSEIALEKLIDLIKQRGMWQEPGEFLV